MVTNYLVLKDLMKQADILARATKLYGQNVTAVLTNNVLYQSEEVDDHIAEYGYALIVLDEKGTKTKITNLEDDNEY